MGPKRKRKASSKYNSSEFSSLDEALELEEEIHASETQEQVKAASPVKKTQPKSRNSGAEEWTSRIISLLQEYGPLTFDQIMGYLPEEVPQPKVRAILDVLRATTVVRMAKTFSDNTKKETRVYVFLKGEPLPRQYDLCYLQQELDTLSSEIEGSQTRVKILEEQLKKPPQGLQHLQSLIQGFLANYPSLHNEKMYSAVLESVDNVLNK